MVEYPGGTEASCPKSPQIAYPTATASVTPTEENRVLYKCASPYTLPVEYKSSNFECHCDCRFY